MFLVYIITPEQSVIARARSETVISTKVVRRVATTTDREVPQSPPFKTIDR